MAPLNAKDSLAREAPTQANNEPDAKACDGKQDQGDVDAPTSELSAEVIARRNWGRPFAKNIHTESQESLLSLSHSGTDYRGLLNLFMLVLVAANLRLVVENLMKYGVLIGLPRNFFDFYRNWPCGVCFLQMICTVIIDWGIERFAGPRMPSDRATNWLHSLAITMVVATPVFTVYTTDATAGNAALLMLFSLTWAMKMVSFAHTCFDIRRAVARGVVRDACQGDETARRMIEDKGFPQCLRLKDVLLFLAYPTLCFQLHYPRRPRIRRRRLLRNISALAFCGLFGYVLVEQYIRPLLENARKFVHMEQGPEGQVLRISLVGLLERLLKLSLPNLYLWLIIFYIFFHSWLNILGELTRFGDRRFYGDWWNASSFGEYWKRWNLPVHHWCLRHVYFPMLRRGWPRLFAGFCVFLLSGVLHEFLVVVPLRLGRPTILVTIAFVMQLPLSIITSVPFFEKKHRAAGNLIFWFAFCFSGQPAAILIYFILASDPHLETIGSILSLR